MKGVSALPNFLLRCVKSHLTIRTKKAAILYFKRFGASRVLAEVLLNQLLAEDKTFLWEQYLRAQLLLSGLVTTVNQPYSSLPTGATRRSANSFCKIKTAQSTIAL